MRYTKFEITNFKGIEYASMDLGRSPSQDVFTLVGLNESGKTTILDAINAFSFKAGDLDLLELPGRTIEDEHELIPINLRHNFNDDIVLDVELLLDAADVAKMKEVMTKSLGLIVESLGQELKIKQFRRYKNSKYLKTGSTFQIDASFRRGRRKSPISLSQLAKEEIDLFTGELRNLIPEILYFQNFLFDFPDKIYLENYGTDDKKHQFYRQVLEDILKSVDQSLDFKTHLLDRATSTDKQDKRSLEALLNKMSRDVSRVVFAEWNRIFSREIKDKEISIACDAEDQPAGCKPKLYVEFKIKEADQSYRIKERSLGFRWFFVFFLLTHYRRYRNDQSSKRVLFLFDEPASNLHQTAQQKLLKSLGVLAKTCTVIYTTHSHHLINPEWLEGTYVVRNAGLSYDAPEDSYNSSQTQIQTSRYREFAVKHPDQFTYFQPILDVLDYQPSLLEPVPRLVMVEGKNDFYVLKYLMNQRLGPESSVLPGTGAGSLDTVIKIYLAWGKPFIILLDGDREGARQKKRYLDVFGSILHDRVFTLGDVAQSLAKKTLDRIITDDDRLVIQKSCYPNAQKNRKDLFARSIQECLINRREHSFSEESRESCSLTLKWIHDMLTKLT